MKRIKLLVSVRSVDEAVAVAKVGVDCIDIKEPRNGALAPLGKQATDVILAALGPEPRCALSFAMGEWVNSQRLGYSWGTGYEKWGLSGCAGTDWRKRFDAFTAIPGAGDRIIPVSYADWETCGAPPPEEIRDVAIKPAVFLIDTFQKDGRSLLDILGFKQLAKQRDKVGTLALAGSIKRHEIETLKSIEPDWIAVRGLVCEDGDRTKPIDPERIQRLKDMLN